MRTPPRTSSGGSPARIGPNSVLRTFEGARALEGPELEARLRAAVPERDWTSLVPEADFVEVVRALRRALPEARAEAVLNYAGERTADYVARHRIPLAVRGVLRGLPARLALPLLLHAFARHAWTFAGGGAFTVTGGWPPTLELTGAPTCRKPGLELGGGYYAAAFEGLLRLAAPRVKVREVACQSAGAPACRFELELEPDVALNRDGRAELRLGAPLL